MKPILLLGGYGGVGRHLARWLLEETEAPVVVAGRSRAKAERLAENLDRSFPGRRVSALAVDASRPESLRPALAGARMVALCTPTMEHTPLVAREALAAGIDYLDMHFLPRIVPVLRELGPEIERKGLCFLTQAGFHPGLLAPLVHLVAPRFTALRKAVIAMAMRFRFTSATRSAAELMETVEPGHLQVFTDGRWREAGLKDFRTFDFGHGFGTWSCAPLDFLELHDLPRRYGLQEAGCYAAGFNWFVDNVLFPTGWLLGRIRKGLAPRLLGRWMAWGVNAFSRPPWGVVMRLEAEGEPHACTVELRHHDVYEFTAVAVAACLKQYLDGSIARPGVWLMGDVAEPVRLFRDLERMGVRIETTDTVRRPRRSMAGTT